MKQLVPAMVSGVLFGVGLAVSGMTQPSKVVGFLDFFGDWDPSLAFVMAGAVLVHFVLFRVVMRRSSPLLAATFHLPTRRDFTPSLILGSGLFGVGWGLGGYCPGPGVSSLGSFGIEALAFVTTMLAGMWLYERTSTRKRKPVPSEAG